MSETPQIVFYISRDFIPGIFKSCTYKPWVRQDVQLERRLGYIRVLARPAMRDLSIHSINGKPELKCITILS